MNEAVLSYLNTTYTPLAILVYGSFADGTNGAGSDFDALVIARQPPVQHDGARVAGVLLDVYLYSPEQVGAQADPADFIQLYGAAVVRDTDDMGRALIDRVRAYVAAFPRKTAQEKRHLVEWCEKMLTRCARGDAEGDYRRHWLLTDSLEIYCDLRDQYYFGPKKTLRRMQREDASAYALCAAAFKEADDDALRAWMDCLTACAATEATAL